MIPCPSCKTELVPPVFNTGGLTSCPSCAAQLRADVYPAFKRPSQAEAGERVLTDSEASCFAHPQKRAVRVCARCGRFMCGLCDIELNGEHLCPPCLDKGAAGGKIQSLQNRRVCYDKVALYVALVSNLFYFFVPFAALAVLFLTLRYWNSPRSPVSRSRVRFVLAAGISLLQLAVIGLMVHSYFIAS